MLTSIEARLAKYFLSQCSSVLGQRGCTDIDLVKDLGLTPEESFALRSAMREANGDAKENPEKPDQHYTHTWWVSAYLSGRVGEVFGIPKSEFKYNE